MTTLSDFRTRVLYALGIGSSSTERGFDNNSIDKHVQQAVEEYSLFLPVQVTADLAVSGGARTASIASLTRPVRLEAVEYPIGQWPRTLVDFDVWGATLTLDHAPPSTD